MLENKPDFNRVIAAFEHREGDRVPLVENFVANEIMSEFLCKEVKEDDLELQIEFWVKAGYDYIPLTSGMMQPGKVTEHSLISKVIKDIKQNQGLNTDNDDEWNLEKKAFIHTERDYDLFPWDEAAKIDFSKFYNVQKFLPNNMKIIAVSGKIFTLSWMLMGYENFCVNLLINPQFTIKVIERVASIQYEAMKKVANMPNVSAIWAVDDIAFGTGTIIKPQLLRELIFPWYKKFAKVCHENNKYLLFHSDGVLWDVMNDLVNVGIDALHPIDPTCMNIEEVKRIVGDKLCLIGNIDNELLMEGTPQQVQELVKRRIKVLAPGGGYCVGSGNSVPEWTKIENFKAMTQTVIKYGKYPIGI